MKTKLYILAAVLLSITLTVLSACDTAGESGDDGPKEEKPPLWNNYPYPEDVKIDFCFSEGGEPINSFYYKLDALNDPDFFDAVKEAFPEVEREGMHLVGYYDTPNIMESGDFGYEPVGVSVLMNADYGNYGGDFCSAFVDKFYSAGGNKPIQHLEIKAYAYYESNVYKINFNTEGMTDMDYSGEDLYGDVDGLTARCSTDFMPTAPVGMKDGKRLVGWENKRGVRVYDFLGNNTRTASEWFHEYISYSTWIGLEYSEDEVELYPVFSEPFTGVILSYGEGKEDVGVTFERGTLITPELLPRHIHEGGRCLAGWSAEIGGAPFDGCEADGDFTLYAIWEPIKALTLWLGDLNEAVEGCIHTDGSITFDKPLSLERYGADKWFSDAEHTAPLTPTFDTVADGDVLYAEMKEIKKQITVNPSNGDTPYTVTLNIDSSEDNFDLPVWSGHEIVGWYTDRECTGDGISLDFDSVTHGETYYAKWQECQ